MDTKLRDDLRGRLEELRAAGLYKGEHLIQTPQSAHVRVAEQGEVLNLCANNYLGLADHPEIVAAAREALDRWGYGMASVRFICGTQQVHRELEERLAAFLGSESAILYGSCFDANGGLFEALLGPEDAVISDALNHASIIDGIRLCKARRLRFANGDMDELEARLTRGRRRPPPADRDRRRVLDGRLPGEAARDLRPGRAPRRDRDGGRLARGRLHGRGRARHPRAARRDRPGGHPHRHARQGDGRGQRRLRGRALRGRRAPAPALAAVPLLEQPGAADRRREPARARPDRALERAARAAVCEHRPLPRPHDRARVRHPAGLAPDRAGDGRRRRPRREPRRRPHPPRRLRRQLLVSRWCRRARPVSARRCRRPTRPPTSTSRSTSSRPRAPSSSSGDCPRSRRGQSPVSATRGTG